MKNECYKYINNIHNPYIDTFPEARRFMYIIVHSIILLAHVKVLSLCILLPEYIRK